MSEACDWRSCTVVLAFVLGRFSPEALLSKDFSEPLEARFTWLSRNEVGFTYFQFTDTLPLGKLPTPAFSGEGSKFCWVWCFRASLLNSNY